MSDAWTRLATLLAESPAPPEYNTRLQNLLHTIHEEASADRKTAKQWTDYYTGEYTVIRRDKLAMLNNIRRQQTRHTDATHCHTCGTRLTPMPCDTFKYCPQCDLPT